MFNYEGFSKFKIILVRMVWYMWKPCISLLMDGGVFTRFFIDWDPDDSGLFQDTDGQ